MSKDNYFFGVRAIDKDGNRSAVTYPKPLGRTAPATTSSSIFFNQYPSPGV
jgi:hypothetical protein